MSDPVCVQETEHLLTTSITYVAGYKCTSELLYWGIFVLAIFLQIGRNLIWVKSAQATREALHESNKDGSRTPYLWELVGYTIVSMALYIANILLILGANIGILCAVLIGNVAGTVWSISNEHPDKTRTAHGLRAMIKEYDALNSRVGQSGCQKLSCEEEKHLKDIKAAKSELQQFLTPAGAIPVAITVQPIKKNPRDSPPFSF